MNEKILINSMNTLTNTSFSEPFFESVLSRLFSFGYIPEESDSWAICFAIQKVENHIKNVCNVVSVPEELFHVAVDRVCGEFLFAKKQTGQLKIGDLDLTGVITSISEGDTSVSFGNGSTDEDKVNQLLNYLMTLGEGDLLCFRKIRW